MELFQYLLGAVFLLFGVSIVSASYVRQIANYRNRSKKDYRWSSPAPFIGPMFTILGYFTMPIEFSSWILLVIVLDPDTMLVVVSFPFLVRAQRDR